MSYYRPQKSVRGGRVIRYAEDAGLEVTEAHGSYKTIHAPKGKYGQLTLDSEKKLNPGELNIVQRFFRYIGIPLVFIMACILMTWIMFVLS